MKVSLNTQPQCVNAAGLQGDSVIFNEGPDRVYLDADGTVSPLLSLPLEPRAYVPWDGGTPLWGVSGGESVISITPNNQIPGTGGFGANHKVGTFYPSAFIGIAKTDCFTQVNVTPYNTIYVNVVSPVTWISPAFFFLLTVKWYDDSGNYLSNTELTSFYPGTVRAGIVFTCPVKGSYATIQLATSVATQSVDSVTLTGTTFSIDNPIENPNLDYNIFPFNVTSATMETPQNVASSTRFNGDDYTAMIPEKTCTIVTFSPRSNTLLLRFQARSNIGTAGTFVLKTDTEIQLTPQTPTGTGATRYSEWTFRVPRTIGFFLEWLTLPVINNNDTYYLSAQWL